MLVGVRDGGGGGGSPFARRCYGVAVVFLSECNSHAKCDVLIGQ